MLELKIQTEIGELTGVFDVYPLNCYEDSCVAWFKEKNILVEAKNINDAIDELLISLKVVLEYEKSKQVINRPLDNK